MTTSQHSDTAQRRNYTGRFAPSPTGPLHFGSLLTAVASYCAARVHAGRWLVRIEDTDLPRSAAGAEQAILDALDRFALRSDLPIVRQRERLEQYQQALDQLEHKQLIYGCACTRKQLDGHLVYPNTCRNLQLPLTGQAVRLYTPDQNIVFNDALQGRQQHNPQQQTGDIVLRRRDGIISYQLAVVVDDAAQGVTHVVRGLDLLDNTARQIWLGDCLGYPRVQYAHLPLAMNAGGQKLSKQNLAQPLNLDDAPNLLRHALLALGQADVGVGRPETLLRRAVQQWNWQPLMGQTAVAGVYA